MTSPSDSLTPKFLAEAAPSEPGFTRTRIFSVFNLEIIDLTGTRLLSSTIRISLFSGRALSAERIADFNPSGRSFVGITIEQINLGDFLVFALFVNNSVSLPGTERQKFSVPIFQPDRESTPFPLRTIVIPDGRRCKMQRRQGRTFPCCDLRQFLACAGANSVGADWNGALSDGGGERKSARKVKNRRSGRLSSSVGRAPGSGGDFDGRRAALAWPVNGVGRYASVGIVLDRRPGDRGAFRIRIDDGRPDGVAQSAVWRGAALADEAAVLAERGIGKAAVRVFNAPAPG